MYDFADTPSYKLRILAVSLLIAACLMLLPVLPYLILKSSSTAHAAGSYSAGSSIDSGMSDSPNAVTRGVFGSLGRLEKASASAGYTASKNLRSMAKSSIRAGTHGFSFVIGGAGDSLRFVGRAAGGVFSNVSDVSAVGIIRPADQANLPVIEFDAHALAHTHEAPVTAESASQAVPQLQIDLEASWPMRGDITTHFGVPHRPYQVVHTGIDISDHKPAGTTPVKPFKPGVVKEVVRSKVGLGNHVIVDHDGGITSVYAHLSSISVGIGQPVDKNTQLGYAGSTGVSTGTHLHFEIRVNGDSVDPRKYISGQP